MKLNYFNFKQFGNNFLLTNDFGKYVFVSREDFSKILSMRIEKNSDLYEMLIERKMLYDETDLEYSAANRYPPESVKFS